MDGCINESENAVAGEALALSEASSQIPTATSEALTTSEEHTQSVTTIGEVSLTTALTMNKECSQTLVVTAEASTSSEEYSQCMTAPGEALTSSEEHSQTPSVTNNENIICNESVGTVPSLSNSLTNDDIDVQADHVGDISSSSCLPGATDISKIIPTHMMDACDKNPKRFGSISQSVEGLNCSQKNFEMDTRDPSEADVNNIEEIRDHDNQAHSPSTVVTDDFDDREKFNNCKM